MVIRQMNWMLRLVIGVAVTVGGVGLAKGQRMLIDDFSDGNDDDWNHLDGVVSGSYDASSFEYNLTSDGPSPVGAPFASMWEGSLASEFSNGWLRGKVRVNTPNTFAWLFMRGAANGTVPTHGYLFGAGNAPGGLAGFQIREINPSDPDPVRSSLLDSSFDVTEEYVFEAGVIGSQLSFKFWLAHDPEPSEPQLTFDDPTPVSMGFFGVGANSFPVPQVISPSFDDIEFTMPKACDFDLNGICDLGYLNALLLEGPVAPGVTVTSGVNDQFDLNGDGLIDNADVDLWLAESATSNGFASPYKRADANLDGVVDGQDFILWNGGKFSSTLLWDVGDFDGDGVADGLDFIIWNQNKFTSSDGVSAVPEPCVGVLLFFAVMCLGAVRLR